MNKEIQLGSGAKSYTMKGFLIHEEIHKYFHHTVRKMDLILRPIERRPQMQFSMARRFKLQLLRRYGVKFYKMRNFTIGPPWLGKTKEHRSEANQHPQDLQPVTLPLRHHYLWYKCRILKRYKHFLPYLPDCVKFRSNEYKVVENALFHMLRKLFIARV